MLKLRAGSAHELEQALAGVLEPVWLCSPGLLNLTLLRHRRATNDYGLALENVRCSVEVAM